MRRFYCSPKMIISATSRIDMLVVSVGNTDAGINDIGFFEEEQP